MDVQAARERGPLRVGVRFDARWPARALPQFARELEALGYDELWFAEDCFWWGGITMAATALAETSRLGVGIGAMPVGMANPASIAMELAALSDLWPGRMTIAFAHGVHGWMDQIGVRPASRLRLLEQTVSAIRSLLAGDLVDTGDTSEVSLHAVRLDQVPDTPTSILIGTTGRRGLALAGRLADGILLPEFCSPAAVRWASKQAWPAGDRGRIVVYGLLGLDEDLARALDRVRPEFEYWMRSGLFPRLAEFAGMGQDGSERLADEMLSDATITGTPAACRRSIRTLHESGATSIVLLPPGPDGREQIEAFALTVLPGLRTSIGAH